MREKDFFRKNKNADILIKNEKTFKNAINDYE